MGAVSLPPRIITADRGDAGRRVDLVLRRHLIDLNAVTRSRVQAWIENGRVSINGRIVKRVSARPALGDTITVLLPDEQPRAPVLPEDTAVDVLFEDEHLLVANKPAGVVSHPTFRHAAGTLMNALLGYARRWPDTQRPSLVGRLDKLTSGAILVAKTTNAHALLQRTLASARSEKAYLALSYGMVDDRGEIALRPRRHPDDRRRVIATEDDGLPSTTYFERLAAIDGGGTSLSLVCCRLATGRMHQIRVHLAARGWPIVGDPKYGGQGWEEVADADAAAALQNFPRQALHAWRLAFAHPITRKAVVVEAPVPADMLALMRTCGIAWP
jgi:23S rRNA pseudouridine1911/1915/1917 synthase